MNFELIHLLVVFGLASISFYLVGRIFFAIFIKLQQNNNGLYMTISPLVGLVLLSLQLWLYGAIHIVWNPILLLLPWVAAAFFVRANLIILLRDDWGRLTQFWRERSKLDTLSWLFVGLIGILLVIFTFRLITMPVVGWDAISMWTYKAKIFYLSQGVVNPSIFNENLRQLGVISNPNFLGEYNTELVRHSSYPPLYSLMNDVMYVFYGKLSEPLGKSVSAILIFTFLASFYSLLRRKIELKYLLALAFVFTSLPLAISFVYQPTNMGLADYPLGIVMFASLVVYLANLKSKSTFGNFVALLLAASAALMKNDGQPFLLIMTLLVAGNCLMVVKQQGLAKSSRYLIKNFGLILLIYVLPVFWVLYAKHNGASSEFFSAANLHTVLPQFVKRIKILAKLTAKFFVSDISYIVMVITALTALVLAIAKRAKLSLLVYLVVALQFASYMVIYLISPFDTYWHFSLSFDRLLLQICPITVLAIALALENASSPARKKTLRHGKK